MSTYITKISFKKMVKGDHSGNLDTKYVSKEARYRKLEKGNLFSFQRCFLSNLSLSSQGINDKATNGYQLYDTSFFIIQHYKQFKLFIISYNSDRGV